MRPVSRVSFLPPHITSWLCISNIWLAALSHAGSPIAASFPSDRAGAPPHPRNSGVNGLETFRKRIRLTQHKIGRAACRERVCQYVYISVVSVYLKKKKTKQKRRQKK